MTEHKITEEGVNGHPYSIFHKDIKSSLLTEKESTQVAILSHSIDLSTFTLHSCFPIGQNNGPYLILLVSQKNEIENTFYIWERDTRKLVPYSIEAQHEDWSYRYVDSGAKGYIYVCITPSPAIAGVTPMKWTIKERTEISYTLDAIYLCLLNMEKRIRNLEEDMKEKVNAMWVSPEMPGYLEARSRFARQATTNVAGRRVYTAPHYIEQQQEGGLD